MRRRARRCVGPGVSTELNGYSSSGSTGSEDGLGKPNEGAGVTGAGFMGSSAMLDGSLSEGLGLEADGKMLGRRRCG